MDVGAGPSSPTSLQATEHDSNGRCVAYLNGLVEELRSLVPKALKRWDVAAIHDARVATRRLRAAMTLLEPALPSSHHKAFTKGLRRLRRRLGPLRDTDVMLEHLESMSKLRRHSAAVAWLTEQVRQQRQKLREQCARKAELSKVLAKMGVWWALEEELKAADTVTRSLLAKSVPQQLSEFAERAECLAKVTVGRQDPPAAGERDDPHALRVAGKALRYSLELAQVVDYPIPKPALSWFKKMQDALGWWHDYLVLSQTTVDLAVEAEIPAHDHTLYGQLLDLAKLAWNRSQHQLRRFAVFWIDGEGELRKSLGDVFHPSMPPPASDSGPGPGTTAPVAIPTMDGGRTPAA